MGLGFHSSKDRQHSLGLPEGGGWKMNGVWTSTSFEVFQTGESLSFDRVHQQMT